MAKILGDSDAAADRFWAGENDFLRGIRRPVDPEAPAARGEPATAEKGRGISI